MPEPEPRRIKLPDATPQVMLESALTSSRTGRAFTDPQVIKDIQRSLDINTNDRISFPTRVGEIGELSSILDTVLPDDLNSLESGHYSALVNQRETPTLTSR